MTLSEVSSTATASNHLGHIVLAGGVLVATLLAVGIVDYLRGRGPRERTARPTMPRDNRIITCVAATAGAAAIHLVVTPVHFTESTLYGVFFVVTATTQLGYAARLAYRPSRLLLGAGMVANASLVALWLVTRIVEIPLGPAAGERESFGGLDVLASGFETVFVVAAALALWHIGRSHAARLSFVFAPACLATVAALVTVTALQYPPS